MYKPECDNGIQTKITNQTDPSIKKLGHTNAIQVVPSMFINSIPFTEIIAKDV